MAASCCSMILPLLCYLWLPVHGQPGRLNYLLPEKEHSPVLEDSGSARNGPKSVQRSSNEFDLNTTVVTAEFNVNYTQRVNVHQQYLFVYSYNETNRTTAVRVSAASSESSINFPVMIVVKQQEGILSWQVPMFIDYSYGFYFTKRTLCPMDENRRLNMTTQQLIYIDVSTMSKEDVEFTFHAQLMPNFQIEHGSTYNFTVSPSEPQYYMYTFPPDVDSVLLRVVSPDLSCTVVSVQKIRCPVFDLDHNIDFDGIHQTMTNKATIFLQKSEYPMFNAFYVVIVMKPTNLECLVPDIIQPAGKAVTRYKTVSISVTKSISSSQYYEAVFASLGVFLSFYIIAAVIGCVYHGCGWHRSISELTDAEKVVIAYSGAPNKRHPDDKSPVDETINPGPPCAYTCAR